MANYYALDLAVLNVLSLIKRNELDLDTSIVTRFKDLLDATLHSPQELAKAIKWLKWFGCIEVHTFEGSHDGWYWTGKDLLPRMVARSYYQGSV